MAMFQETRRERLNHSSYRIVGAIAILTAVVTIIPWTDRLNISQPLIKSMGQTHLTSTSEEPRGDLPEVAWLMSFPNSGTTYTLQLIQQYTNTTTATNYGNEQGVHGTNTPLHPWMETGPFCRHLGWNLPPRYILTKTHCGGTAMSPDPEHYIETHRSFEIACRSGNRVINDTKKDVTYSMDIPKRAVHLMRNPFDNIVARLHLAQKKWGRADSEENQELLQQFNATREGFQAWCSVMDTGSVKQEEKSHFFDPELWELARQIPCHGEIIRYTWWHNNAVELARQRNIPVHNLYYEDYSDDWQKTVDQLFGFLGLSPAPGAEPLQFITGKHYEDYYDPKYILLARKLVHTLASPEAWILLKRYFQ